MIEFGMRRVGKPIEWVGCTKADLSAFPPTVKLTIGHALHLAQIGDRHKDVKPLKGDLAGVEEILVDGGDSDTYRALYIVKLGDVVYALDAFKKKSTKGSNLAKRDRERIKERLRAARAHARRSPAR
jgi:phage-related protein